MGYQVWKDKKGWRLICVTDHGKRGAEKRSINKRSSEFKELGFDEEMTIEQARRRIKSIQAEHKLKIEFQRRARIEGRLKTKKLIESASLPEDLVKEYEASTMVEENIRMEHWLAAQAIIVGIPVTPDQWFFRKALIYNLLAEKKYSPDYSNRLLRVLNSWGYYYAIRLNRAWRPLPRLQGQFLKNALKAYYGKGVKTETVPASVELLSALKGKVQIEKWNWCNIAFWFGLRPHEVDMLTKPSLAWRIDTSDERFPVLYINQSKLVAEGIDPNKAWKAIPGVEAGQLNAIKLIRLGNFKRPSAPWFRKHFAEGQTARSFRKGFNIHMRMLGYLKEDRQKWMGHQSAEMIDQHYEDNLQVSFHGRRQRTG